MPASTAQTRPGVAPCRLGRTIRSLTATSQPTRKPATAWIGVLVIAGGILCAPGIGRGDDQPASRLASAPQASRFIDGQDGTITDSRTGLMWEKKCGNCDGLHDVRSKFRWSGDGKAETVWDWLEKVNGRDHPSGDGTGLAGYSDWRLANIKELASIIEYATFDPAAASVWNSSSCEPSCSDATAASCSCIAPDLYWTSTTFADFPAHALVVDFAYGFVDDRLKTNRHHARAVRGRAQATDSPTTKDSQ